MFPRDEPPYRGRRYGPPPSRTAPYPGGSRPISSSDASGGESAHERPPPPGGVEPLPPGGRYGTAPVANAPALPAPFANGRRVFGGAPVASHPPSAGRGPSSLPDASPCPLADGGPDPLLTVNPTYTLS